MKQSNFQMLATGDERNLSTSAVVLRFTHFSMWTIVFGVTARRLPDEIHPFQNGLRRPARFSATSITSINFIFCFVPKVNCTPDNKLFIQWPEWLSLSLRAHCTHSLTWHWSSILCHTNATAQHLSPFYSIGIWSSFELRIHFGAENWICRAKVSKTFLFEPFTHIILDHLTNGRKLNCQRKEMREKREERSNTNDCVGSSRPIIITIGCRNYCPFYRSSKLSCAFLLCVFFCGGRLAATELRLCQIRASKRNTIVCGIFQLLGKVWLIEAIHWNLVEVVPTIVWPVRIQGKSHIIPQTRSPIQFNAISISFTVRSI